MPQPVKRGAPSKKSAGKKAGAAAKKSTASGAWTAKSAASGKWVKGAVTRQSTSKKAASSTSTTRKAASTHKRAAVDRHAVPEMVIFKMPRARNAVVVLDQLAMEDSVYVVHLLEAVANMARRRTLTGTLPASEREVWESLGARFDDLGVGTRSQARSAAAFADLLAQSVAGDAAAAQLLGGKDRSRISQKLSERSLFAVLSGTERYFPRWQFVDGKPLRGLKDVLGALDPKLHPLNVQHWFTTPNLELEVEGDPLTPVSWLATGGDVEVAAQLAANV